MRFDFPPFCFTKFVSFPSLSSQAEECKETFKKDCHIEYEKEATLKKMQLCRDTLVRDCEQEGEVKCSPEKTTGTLIHICRSP